MMMRSKSHRLPTSVFTTRQRYVRGRRGWKVEVSNDTEQREGILIISLSAPAIRTFETDRAKHQLMRQYPHRDLLTLTWTQQQPSYYSNHSDEPGDADGGWCSSAGLWIVSNDLKLIA